MMNKDIHKYARYMTINQETRWATADEIKNSATHITLSDNTYASAGLPIFANNKEIYVDGSDTHSLIFGSTGSKKTRLFCMPMINLFAKAGESFIVSDPKGELFQKTAGFVKKQGHKIVVLNFRDIGAGDCWNPLSLPYSFYHSGDDNLRDKATSMINDFVKCLVAPQEKNTTDAFWPQMSTAYLLACIMLLMEVGTPENVNIKTLANMCHISTAKKLDTLAHNMKPSSLVAQNFKSVFSSALRTRQSILATSYGSFSVFNSQDQLANMISKNTIDLANIGKEKTAVYIIVPDEKTTLHFLISVFIKQAYEMLIDAAQGSPDFKLPIRVNFLLDEFCNMPTISDMPSMISAARSRNIRFFLIAQSKHQLIGKYGEDAETIKGNCENWVFLTSKELSLLNEISELCGDIIEPGGYKRRLISPSELQRLSKEKGEALIIHARHYPFISEFPDIDSYKDFKSLAVPKLKSFKTTEVETLNFIRLINQIKIGAIPIPFGADDYSPFYIPERLNERWSV